jgi:hypothetical protein
MHWRGGSGVAWGNSIRGFNSAVKLLIHRNWNTYANVWESCDGLGSYDSNDTTGGPLNDGVYETGRHTGPDGAQVLEDKTKSWQSGQWAHHGFSIVNTATRRRSIITGNTTTTISRANCDIGGCVQLTFNTGQPYEIRRGAICIDQPGRGQGRLLSDARPARGWPGQALEPIFVWGNTLDDVGAVVDSGATHGKVIQNRDFYVCPTGAERQCAAWLNSGVTLLGHGGETITYSVGGYTPFAYPHPLRGRDPHAPR